MVSRLVLALLLAAGGTLTASAQGNVLLLIGDDMGVDTVGAYGVGSDLPATPTLDALAAGGLMFRNAWSNPVCSPTRATMLTGRYAFRTGVGQVVQNFEHSVALNEFTLPRLLDLGTGGAYSHAAFGKWHLAGFNNGNVNSPNLLGFSHFQGTLNGLDPFFTYFDWDELEDGSFSHQTTYNTTEIVDDVLAWTAGRTEPWFAWVAFNAPHFPYHAPPSQLHTVDLTGEGDPGLNPRPYYKAMIEAMDTEIDRLLTGLGPELANTTVIFLGDNGTPSEVIAPPLDPLKSKKTVFEGGVNVPLIISGPGVVAGAETQGLVNTTDILATVVELAGVNLQSVLPPSWQHDSVSMVPYFSHPQASLRTYIYAEFFSPNGSGPYALNLRALRDKRFKLVRSEPDLPFFGDRFTDLQKDPDEVRNLMDAQQLSPLARAAWRLLGKQLHILTAPLLMGGLVKQG